MSLKPIVHISHVIKKPQLLGRYIASINTISNTVEPQFTDTSIKIPEVPKPHSINRRSPSIITYYSIVLALLLIALNFLNLFQPCTATKRSENEDLC